MDAAAVFRRTVSSSEFTCSLRTTTASCILPMSPVNSTPQMCLLKAYTWLWHSFFLLSTSQINSSPSLSTSEPRPATAQPLARFLQPILGSPVTTQRIPWVSFSSTTGTPKQCFNYPILQATSLVYLWPYREGLLPNTLALCPYYLVLKRLLKWVPAVIPLYSEEDNTRIATVLVQGYAEKTRQIYEAGLLLYYIFCDARLTLELNRALAAASLITIFLATIIGFYSASAVNNTFDGLWVWHVIYNL